MCFASDYDHYFNQMEETLLTEIERATLAREADVYYSVNYIGARKMTAVRTDLKNEFENLARRNRGKYLDHTPTAEINTYAVYFRDRDGWVYCWAVEVDEKDEIKHAQELLVFDSENAPEAIPACIAEEAARLERWKENMRLDPLHDEAYYHPASINFHT